MHYLFLTVALTVAFSQLLRFGQRRGEGIWPLTAVNYAVAAVAAVALVAVTQGPAAFDVLAGSSWAVWLGGPVNGAFYFLHLVVLLRAYRLAGVGITFAVTMSGSVIPVLVAWSLWGEAMTPQRWLAVALLPPAMVLLRPVQAEHAPLGPRADAVLLVTFLFHGAINTIHKAASVYDGEAAQPLYQLLLFVVAALVSVGYAAAARKPGTRYEVAVGTIVGVVNIAATLSTLLALKAVRAAVFFPMSSCLVIVLNAAVAALLWKERVTRRQVVGVALAMVIVVMVNV